MGSYGTGDEGRPNTNTDEEEDLPNVTPVAPIVVQPPGVDPYYGITISPLLGGNGNSGGNIPDSQDGLGGATKGDRTGQNDPAYRNYLISAGGWRGVGNNVIPPDGAMSYTEWKNITNSINSNSNIGSGGASGGFMIARPNMTWANNLPSVIPPNGQALADMYGPTPFTRTANTPGVSYVKPSLTYNNPYNTNPYLPLSNPFALIANNTNTSTS